MTMTKGRIQRAGKIRFHDASINVWEEVISGYEGRRLWDRQFKRDVFARIVQQLNRLGWTCVVPDEMIKQYSLSFAINHRYCTKGDLQADLSIGGRCIELRIFQNVNAPDRPDHGGRYQNNKEMHMPYPLRLEMERTRRRIRDYLCSVFTDYEFEPPKPKLGINGVTALEYAAHGRRTSGHYVKELDRATFNGKEQGTSADGYPLENGMRVYAQDWNGRIITGIAFYSLNSNWQIVTGRYGVSCVQRNLIWVKCPERPRVKRNSDKRRKRLEAEMSKAIKSMNFERAAVLRDILFSRNTKLFVVWHEEHKAYHGPGFSGYTSDQSKAGKFTADEVRNWQHQPNKVIAI